MKVNFMIDEVKLKQILALVEAEIRRTEKKYQPFHSMHEGLAIFEEEAYELKLEVYKSTQSIGKVTHEAVHAAAMAIRIIYDIRG